MSKKRGGRPDKRSDRNVVRLLVLGIEQGLTYEMASIKAGIGVRPLYRWKREGERAQEGTLAVRFWQALKKAEALAAHRALLKVQEGKKGWQASAWFLERRFPEYYRRREKSLESRSDF